MRLLGTPATFCQSCFGVVVLAEDGDVELVLGQAVVLGDQVPGELDGLGLEVIAEGKIAQHLEEGVVAARVADVFQVVVLAARAHAFLRAGGARVVALLQAQEDVLELVHAGVGEQQRRVVGRDQRRAAHHAVAAGGKEVEKALSDFVTCHGDSLWMWTKSNCSGARQALVACRAGTRVRFYRNAMLLMPETSKRLRQRRFLQATLSSISTM